MFGNFFSNPGFMPHIHCYLDHPSLVWTMMITDLLIGLAYVGISITLWAIVKRINIPFTFVILCFGLFIGACGTTHFMEIWTLWNPDYWWAAAIKVITAVASVGTAIYLFRLRHMIVEVAEASKLSENQRRELEVLAKTLESRIQERTQTLEETSTLLRALMNSSSDVIFVKDRSSRMLYCNPFTLRLLGVTERELYGKNDVEFLGAGNGGEAILLTDQRVMESEKGETAQEWVTWKNGHKRLYMSVKEPYRDAQGKVVGVLGISRDITELKNVQTELENSVRARDEFLSIASHELKTPLTSMRLQTDLVRRLIDKGDPSAYSQTRIDAFAELADKQLKRLSRLVDDMLDIARIRSGNLSLVPSSFDLCSLVKEAVSRMHSQFVESGCGDPKVTYCEPAHGVWDRMRLEQVVDNLLTNAIRYGKGKPIEITVECLENSVQLSVKDYGIGIAKEAQAKIFDRFERAVDANEVSGLGLGLFISKQIVEAHGGTISVESELGKGSTFLVRVPIKN